MRWASSFAFRARMALYIAMRALAVKPGDEVITSAHSGISTSETTTQAGGWVVFCDTDADTFTIDPAAIF